LGSRTVHARPTSSEPTAAIPFRIRGAEDVVQEESGCPLGGVTGAAQAVAHSEAALRLVHTLTRVTAGRLPHV